MNLTIQGGIPSLPRGNGRMLPYWLDVKDPEAQRGTSRVRAIDPNLIVGLDTRRHVYMIFGPSLDVGGWIPLVDCQDDYGRPFRHHVPWEVICAAIRRQLEDAERGIFVTDRVRERNERQIQAADRAQREHTEAAIDYFADAISGELSGSGRHDAEDVTRGWFQRWI